jgi:hypothetical protein
MYVYASMHIRIYIYMYIYRYIKLINSYHSGTSASAPFIAGLFSNINAKRYLRNRPYTYIYIYIYIYIYMYVYIYIYIEFLSYVS